MNVTYIRPKLGVLIVFEGPDCSGKTTAAKKVARNFNANYYKMTYRFKDNMFWYMTAVFRQVERDILAGKNVVLDRFWISEAIYGKAFNRRQYQPQLGRFMERLYKKYDYIGVLCKPWSEVEEQVERHKASKDPDHPYDCSDYRFIVECYDELAETIDSKVPGKLLGRDNYMSLFRAFNWHVYDYTKDPTALKLMGKIYPSGVQTELSNVQLMKYSGATRTAQKVILGERSNPKTRINIEYPFHEYQNSSLFMANSLQRLGLIEDDFVYANAFCDYGIDHKLVDLLVEKYGRHNVLALSYSVGNALKQRGHYNFYTAVHPSYAKRFNQQHRFEEDIRRFLDHEPEV